jgi:bleomycin hydrolase
MLFTEFHIRINIKYSVVTFLVLINVTNLTAQGDAPFFKKIPCTGVKDQARTGACWSFSIISLLESQAIKDGMGEFDLSEMFTVRNIYVEKAKNYLLRQGAAQFGSGGLGHDAINAIAKYGIVPESVYSGLLAPDKKAHDHSVLDLQLKHYLDSLLKVKPIPFNWMNRFREILDKHLGRAPDTFTYKGKVYTPDTFAKEILQFKRDDYVFITSFTHHPFYRPFILEIPDNFANESYYNVPLEEMLAVVKQSIEKGYSLMWDTDVSNSNFRYKAGLALLWKDLNTSDVDAEEAFFDQSIRQELFECLVTQDDHLMHVVGIEKTKRGKTLFLVKNSWGEQGPFKGYIKVSEAYLAVNTIALVVPKAAINEQLMVKLGL